jgi:DNA sulfur modification protein DndC
MERYEYVDRDHRVAVTDRLKSFNLMATDVWDYLANAGFTFHGVVREWSAIFLNGLFYAFHHFINDQPQEDCIPPNSGFTWQMIFQHESEPDELFSFLERIGFGLYLPEQAAIDALIDDGSDWHYMSPKHKFQVYAFHPSCTLLIEIYLQQIIPPYGAKKEPIPFPKDRCQPFLDFDVSVGCYVILYSTLSVQVLINSLLKMKKLFDVFKLVKKWSIPCFPYK